MHVTGTVNLTTLVHCKCHVGKQTAIARINQSNQNETAYFTFSNTFVSWSHFAAGANARFTPHADAHD